MKNKSLDDVIFTMKFQDTDSNTVADAVEYLRDYRDLLQIVAKLKRDFDFLTVGYSEYIGDNPPLTWEELKQMIGKPVYIHEWHYGDCSWKIIKDFETIDGEEWIIFNDMSRYPKSDLYEMSTIHKREVPRP